jgi:exodeoxyribonuclease V alpha subunit
MIPAPNDAPLARFVERVAALFLASAADRRDGAALLRAVLAAEAAGHTELPVASPLFARLVVEAGGDVARLRRELAKAEDAGKYGVFAPLFAAENPAAPLSARVAGDTKAGLAIATMRAFAEEASIATKLHRLLAREVPPLAVDEAVLVAPVRLHERQRLAVETVARAPFAVITGGPGTGKTSIVLAILRAVTTSSATPIPPEKILLAAPTGKAAQRLSAATRSFTPANGGTLPAAATLHRLLAWDPKALAFRRNAASPLDAALVIVDEASMIDLPLFHALLDALPPKGRLVLLGDADQLPSVGPGAILRDLVAQEETSKIPVVLLTESYRMDPKKPGGRHVLLFARAVLASGGPVVGGAPVKGGPPSPASPLPANSLVDADGRAPELSTRFAPGREAMPKVHLGYEGFLAAGKAEGVHILPPTEAVLASLTLAAARFFLGPLQQGPRAAIQHVFSLKDGALTGEDLTLAQTLLALHDGFRILSPLKEMPRFGVRALNAQVHAHFVRLAPPERAEYRFLRGEPVIVTANDYRRSLWNGDQGTVILASRDGAPPRPEVLFSREDGIVSHPLAAIADRLDHAYALTVHKSQGSEFQRIVLVLPPEGHPLADKGNLYTAATRARDAVVLVTGGVGLSRAATTKTERFTGLASALQRPL